jgi:hypothetical protein
MQGTPIESCDIVEVTIINHQTQAHPLRLLHVPLHHLRSQYRHHRHRRRRRQRLIGCPPIPRLPVNH